ncbi:SDR family oxidoreductase [Pseudonocardia sichuanensis]
MGNRSDEVLVTGGRGTLGRLVVRRLTAAGVPVRLLSRRLRPADAPPPVTWITGDQTDPDGMRAALDGVGAVVHCASSVRSKDDLVGARVLVDAGAATGQPHVVYISIVGVDRIPLGYYRIKQQVEAVLQESGLPVTIQRATQFHELFLEATRMLSRSPLVPVPAGVWFQPIAADEVAARLVTLASGEPRGRVPDIGGPDVHRGEDLVRACLHRLGKRRLVVPIPARGRTVSAYRAGYHRTRGPAHGRTTFTEFLHSTGAAA